MAFKFRKLAMKEQWVNEYMKLNGLISKASSFSRMYLSKLECKGFYGDRLSERKFSVMNLFHLTLYCILSERVSESLNGMELGLIC